MKSQTRAWLVTLILLLSWGTLLAAPFRYFAEMLRDWGRFMAGLTPFSAGTQTLLVYLWMTVLLAVSLVLGRGRQTIYLAGIFALAEVCYHLVICIRNNQLYDVSLPLTIGLALALLFLLIRSKSPSLWLTDFFVCGLAVWLLYDSLLAQAVAWLKLAPDALAPIFVFPKTSLIASLQDFWHLPLVAWVIGISLLAVIPLVFLTAGRQKG